MTAIGMITPSSNTCLEPVTYRLLAGTPDVTAHFARIPVIRIGLDEDSTSRFDAGPMKEAARLLADAGVDVIVWNGTSGSWLGPDQDRAVCGAIEEATGIPATTTTLGLLAACRAYGITRLGLAVPYTPDVTGRIAEVYAAHGVTCVASDHLGLDENRAFGAVPETRVAEQIRAVTTPEAEAAAVVCTNVHGAGVAPGLERELGVPVLDSVAVTLWHALHLAGGPPIAGHGDLLATGTLRARLQDVVEELLRTTGADRTTLRLDLPAYGLHVDLPVAEATGPGTRSIRRDPSLPQRDLNTVRWLEEHRRPLVQPHFREDPSPPQALIDVYGVNAQVLGPVVRDGDLAAWLSVHSLSERPWTDGDLRALQTATTTVHNELDGLPDKETR